MPVKRSRIETSSSPVSTVGISCDGQANVVKVDGASEALRRNIWTSSPSPASVGESDQTMIGGFLERCHYCKKRIAQDSEVFMYGNLCAFCSAECREFQIKHDQLAEKQAANKKATAVQKPKIHNLRFAS